MKNLQIKLTKAASKVLSSINKLDVDNTEKAADLRKDLSKLKASAVKSKNEPLANLYWCFEQSLELKISYLKAWNFICKRDYYTAWNYLIDGESIYASLIKHSPADLTEYLKLDQIESLIESTIRLYPFWHKDCYGVFTSNEEVYTKWKCSICNTEYKYKPKCSHIRGQLYMGELCSKVILEGYLKAIAFVQNPFDKRCVTVSCGEKHFNDLYNFTRLDDLVNTLKPLQYWEIDSIETKGTHEHINVGISTRTIYGEEVLHDRKVGDPVSFSSDNRFLREEALKHKVQKGN